MASTNRRISCKQAIRAIYIDFEGFRGKPPILLGELCQQDFKQHVLDSDYFDLFDVRVSGVKKRDDVAKSDPHTLIESLLERCKNEDRLLVAYGHRERTAIRKDYSLDASKYYRDGLLIVRDWVKDNFDPQPEDYGLKGVLEFLGYERIPEGKIQTRRLRDVRDGLISAGKLTRTQKAKWTKLLRHNRVDCQSLRDLVLLASSPRG